MGLALRLSPAQCPPSLMPRPLLILAPSLPHLSVHRWGSGPPSSWLFPGAGVRDSDYGQAILGTRASHPRGIQASDLELAGVGADCLEKGYWPHQAFSASRGQAFEMRARPAEPNSPQEGIQCLSRNGYEQGDGRLED